MRFDMKMMRTALTVLHVGVETKRIIARKMMIRFIIRERTKTCDSCPMEKLITLDLEVPELERILKKGGYDQYYYEHYDLIGVEIKKEDDE